MATDGEPNPDENHQEQPTESGRQTFDRLAGPKLNLKDLVRYNPGETFNIDPEELRLSSEKVERYMREKTTGIDGKPLPAEAAQATIDSVKIETDARVKEFLGRVASGDTIDLQDAVDTYLLKDLFDNDEAYREAHEKAERYASLGEITRLHGENELTSGKGFDAPTKINPDINAYGIPDDATRKIREALSEEPRRSNENPEQTAKPVQENPEPTPPTPTPTQGPTGS